VVTWTAVVERGTRLIRRVCGSGIIIIIIISSSCSNNDNNDNKMARVAGSLDITELICKDRRANRQQASRCTGQSLEGRMR